MKDAAAPRTVAVVDVRLVQAPDGGPAAGDRAAVLFRDGRVAAVAPLAGALPAPFRDAAEQVDGGGLWLLPGLVDIQINDIEWLATGMRRPAEHRERIGEVIRYQLARGVTGFVLATLAAPEGEIVAYLRGMREVMDAAAADPGAVESAFLGALVEGTFMNPAFHGAHNPAYVAPPEIPLLDRFLDTGAVRLLNVAPEMAPGALDVIAHASQSGVVVGVGHARPHARRVREAVAAGLRYVIHLGNGPTGSSLKGFNDGGLLEEALANDDLAVTLIVDGRHLDLRLVRDWIERKGFERSIAVSDAGFAMGPPGGEFEVFGVRGRVSADGDYLEVAPAEGTPPPNPLSSESALLFGSAADMPRVFEITANLLARDVAGVSHRRHAALDPVSALREASRLCARNPALLLGERDRGSLLPGSRADAILARLDGEPGRWRVITERVWLAARRAA